MFVMSTDSDKRTYKEDEQSILFETLSPNRLFSEPTLTLRDLHMVVPASLLFSYSFFLFLHTMQSFKQYVHMLNTCNAVNRNFMCIRRSLSVKQLLIYSVKRF